MYSGCKANCIWTIISILIKCPEIICKKKYIVKIVKNMCNYEKFISYYWSHFRHAWDKNKIIFYKFKPQKKSNAIDINSIMFAIQSYFVKCRRQWKLIAKCDSYMKNNYSGISTSMHQHGHSIKSATRGNRKRLIILHKSPHKMHSEFVRASKRAEGKHKTLWNCRWNENIFNKLVCKEMHCASLFKCNFQISLSKNVASPHTWQNAISLRPAWLWVVPRDWQLPSTAAALMSFTLP